VATDNSINDGTSINGVTCPTPVNQPALGAYDLASQGTLLTDISKRKTQYTTGPSNTVPNSASNVGPTLASDSIDLTTVDGLTAFVNMTVTLAGPNVYPNGTVPTNLGTTSNPVVNVVNGDLTLSGSGAGVLLVTGQFTMNGNFSWNGLILVIGEGAVLKNGGGGATITGALFAANLFSDPKAGTSGPGAYPGYSGPIALGANNPPGIPFFNWNGGGTATVQYDSCWIQSVNQSLPYHIVTQRELSY